MPAEGFFVRANSASVTGRQSRRLWRVVFLCEKVFKRTALTCSRNNNVGGSDNYDGANYNHTRRLDIHTSRHDNYTRSDDYDPCRHHHNATCHHNLNARSVSIPFTRRFLALVAVRRRRPSRYDRRDRPTIGTNVLRDVKPIDEVGRTVELGKRLDAFAVL